MSSSERFDVMIEIYNGAIQKAKRLGREFEEACYERRLTWLKKARHSGDIVEVATWLAEADAHYDPDASAALRVALVAIVNPPNKSEVVDAPGGRTAGFAPHAQSGGIR